MPQAHGCATVARTLEGVRAGSAAYASGWLLVEHPGPWPRAPLRSGVLGTAGVELAKRATDAGVRVQLIRGHDRRSPGGGPTAFLIRATEHDRRIETRQLGSEDELLDIDLFEFVRGGPGGWSRVDDRPLLLVCTHGKRDACCAVHGRRLAGKLDAGYPGLVWKTTHVGGDRFAPNLVHLPSGAYFGHVDPSEGSRLVDAVLHGQLTLAHYRGRSCHPRPVQAADVLLRRRYGMTALGELTIESWSQFDEDTWVVTAFGSRQRLRAHVRWQPTGQPRFTTCFATDPLDPGRFELTSVIARAS